MSHKITIFTTGCPLPQTSDRFTLFIPGVFTAPLRVYETILPFEVRNAYNVSIGGQTISLPGKTNSTGDWVCSLYESALFDVITQVDNLKKSQFIYDSDKGKSSLQKLSSQDPSDVMKSFKLIEPIIFMTDQLTGTAPVYATVLKGAWIQSIESITLNASSSDSPLKWKLHFKYQYIDHMFTSINI